jgi:Ca2+-transporting ATPase
VRGLGTDLENGLDPEEIDRRRAGYGPNVIAEGRRRGPLRMFVDQFADLMVLILLAAAVVAGSIGEPQDTAAIAVIVVLNATLGFVQEYRAERAVAALKALAAPQAQVRRGGAGHAIPAADLVPGDVVVLDAGAAVPADVRLVQAAHLRVDESTLTGESHPVDKVTAPLAGDDLALGDRRNMAYKGTLVTHGRGCGVVVATGMHTELGRIAALLHGEAEVKTPLQRRLARLGKQLALAILGVCALVFGVGLFRGEEPLLMLLTAVSLAVAAIPEALPAVVTVALAIGARKMARQNALIRRLPAVETLGSVTYICSDKTGTLTENRMRVVAFHVGGSLVDEPPRDSGGDGPWPMLLLALALDNDARATEPDAGEGDPTEVALLLAAARAGFAKHELESRLPRLAEIPFSSERARMSTLHADGAGGVLVFTKGAPEQVLGGCMARLTPAGPVPLDAADVLVAAAEMAARGLRVLALSYRRLPDLPVDPDADAVESDQTFLGLVGLIDPPRAEAKEAVALCRSAGIHVVMITGDHPATARAIADVLGIGDSAGRVVTGPELARLPPDVFAAEVQRIRTYARVAPEQKIQIVKALQDRGEFAAMTGDGVNDAPALRRADIGIAMGRSGTDVAREAAHMVLLDDDFATIVRAVREGRRIYDNIRKFVRYVLTGNSAEIWTLFVAPFLQLPIPLLPIHILWVNLVTDGLPGLALAVEPAERGVMRRPPRPPRESLFAHGLWQHAVWVGVLMGGVTLATQAWAIHVGSAHWQSMTFTVLTLSQMGHVLAIRSERESLFVQGLWSNRPLLGAVVLTFLMQGATLYVPALQPIFKTQPLSPGELLLCLALSSVVFAGVEVEKWMVRRGWLYRASLGRNAPST